MKIQGLNFSVLEDGNPNLYTKVNTLNFSVYLGNFVSSSSYKLWIAFLSTVLCLLITDNLKEK